MSGEQAKKERKLEVRIHIDRKPYESPNPTTGEALYELGKIGINRELFKEDYGDQEDELISRTETVINLKEDEHFYSEVDFHIIVNAQKKAVTTKVLSFSEVVRLAFNPPPVGPNILFTITYRNGPHKNPEGTLLEGKSVKIRDGMIFNVTQTDKS